MKYFRNYLVRISACLVVIRNAKYRPDVKIYRFAGKDGQMRQ